MIKSITVTNNLGESIIFELTRPEQSGFVVQSIDGLGPSKADIHITEVSTMDGALYNSARVNSRNIVLNLKLLANPTVEDTRQLSYKYFPLKKRIRLLIETDNRTSETYGYVETNEPNIFSSSETTQISIICPDPNFYSLEETITVFSGITPMFEFPFSDNSLVPDWEWDPFNFTNGIIPAIASGGTLEFGSIKNEAVQGILYLGDTDIGIVITMHALGTVENVLIYNSDTGELMRIDTTRLAILTGHVIIAGDDIIISTVKGNKYITLLRQGVYTNILNCLDKNTAWFQLSRGNNHFNYIADGDINLEFVVKNQTVYGGV